MLGYLLQMPASQETAPWFAAFSLRSLWTGAAMVGARLIASRASKTTAATLAGKNKQQKRHNNHDTMRIAPAQAMRHAAAPTLA